MKTIGKVIRGAVLVAQAFLGCAVANAASPYLYFEDFENGTPTSGWDSPAPAALVSGTNGISTGASGGSHYGLAGNSFGPTPLWRAPSTPTPLPAGTWSFQLDVYPQNNGLSFFSPFSTQATEPPSISRYNAEMTNFGRSGTSPLGGPAYRASNYYTPSAGVWLPLTPKWYTFEWAFVPGTTIDPVSGRPYVDFVFNVYEQAQTNANGYRSAQPISSFQGILNYYDYGGLRLAASTSWPTSFQFQGAPAAIDNFAVGPMINAPEPATGLAALAMGCLAATIRRRRR